MAPNRSADITGLGLRAPLIGRQEPLRSLFEMAEQVRGGQTRITSIVGPPGIGKTRLASDFAFDLQQQVGGFRYVYRSLGRSSATSHGLFARLLRSRFGLSEGTTDSEAWQQLRKEVAQVSAERDVADVCSFLAQLLDVAPPKSSLGRVLAD